MNFLVYVDLRKRIDQSLHHYGNNIITMTLHPDNRDNNDLILHEESPMCTSLTMTLIKLRLDNHEVHKTTLANA